MLCFALRAKRSHVIAMFWCPAAHTSAMFCSSFLETQKPQINIQGVPVTSLRVWWSMFTLGPSASPWSWLSLWCKPPQCFSTEDFLRPAPLFCRPSSVQTTEHDPALRNPALLKLERKSKRAGREELLKCGCLRGLLRTLATELVSYLEDDRLCVEEEQVFETLLAWIHHDPFSRCGTIHDLFRRVRLRHVHPSYLFQFIANDPLVQTSSLCTEIIESVRRLLFSVGTHCPGNLELMWAAPRRHNSRRLL